jgi:hypothetical protein
MRLRGPRLWLLNTGAGIQKIGLSTKINFVGIPINISLDYMRNFGRHFRNYSESHFDSDRRNRNSNKPSKSKFRLVAMKKIFRPK